MDEPILRRYQSAEGAESYSKKFQKHWNERLNNTFERRLVQRLLNEVSRNDRPHRALDMPCGYGRLYPLLAEASAEVVECDWSHPMLLRARESQSRMPTGGARRHVNRRAGHRQMIACARAVVISRAKTKIERLLNDNCRGHKCSRGRTRCLAELG